MHLKETTGIVQPENTTWDGELWNMQKVKEFALAKPGRCIVLLEGFAVDATEYLAEHVSFVGLWFQGRDTNLAITAWRGGHPSEIFRAVRE